MLIVTALGVVAFVLILFLLRNPVLYRQTFVQLRAADNLSESDRTAMWISSLKHWMCAS